LLPTGRPPTRGGEDSLEIPKGHGATIAFGDSRDAGIPGEFELVGHPVTSVKAPLKVYGVLPDRAAGPLDHEDGGPWTNPEGARHRGIGAGGRDPVAPREHRNPVFPLQDPVDGLFCEVVRLKELRIEGGEPRPVHGEGVVVSQAETIKPEDGASGFHTQALCHLGRAGFRGPVKNGRAGYKPRASHVLREVREPDETGGDPPIAHKGAEPLPPVNESIGLERLEGTAHGYPAHSETLREFMLGGELCVGHEMS